MKLSGWGRYPVIEAKPLFFHDIPSLVRGIKSRGCLIPYGNGKSYGDSALAKRFVPIKRRDRMISFDKNTGLLTCEAGVLLSDIIDTFLPHGWFLKVTPGTKLITLGGAIASDVHGKNHHLEGCFSDSVESFLLMVSDGEILYCSRTENQELFLATCGGMGLTGIILQASFYLKRIYSKNIHQTTIKTRNLQETFDAFEKYLNYPYSVAWIDCLAKHENLGRSLLMIGNFMDDADFDYQSKNATIVPFNLPSFVLNYYSVKTFNHLYYSRYKLSISQQIVDIDNFFYPLDAINNWNRIYGRKGFVQYQFILPKQNSYVGLEKILKIISKKNITSFLAVLKLYGPANKNYLSFPLEGYSLALDFKLQPGLFELLDKLDQVVVENQGRIYLTKDVRVNRKVFEKGYPYIDKFRLLRSTLKLNRKFKSLQSERLEL